MRLRGTFWKFNDLSVSDVGLWGCQQARVRGRTAMSVGRLRRRTRGRYVGSVWGRQRGWVRRDRLCASRLSRSRLGATAPGAIGLARIAGPAIRNGSTSISGGWRPDIM